MKTVWLWGNLAKVLAVAVLVCAAWVAAVWWFDLGEGVAMLGGFVVGMTTMQIELVFWKPWRFD